MAVRYSTKVDEPIKDILDGVHNDHIEALVKDVYGGSEANVPVVEYFGGKILAPSDTVAELDGVSVIHDGSRTTYRLPTSTTATLPDMSIFRELAIRTIL
ncbi:fatty acid synthase beta subunit dehydratase [Lasallia pustulata]|uniref:Fatty acid synthase beta subunit dehydratase n=1 Tax=Lasallia pustulata TaxID=136370 RepID=A0A1W5D7L7_9LECA|nr:fatty acid synthase beta subunit dehydratase [Lasallia pustulata]